MRTTKQSDRKTIKSVRFSIPKFASGSVRIILFLTLLIFDVTFRHASPLGINPTSDPNSLTTSFFFEYTRHSNNSRYLLDYIESESSVRVLQLTGAVRGVTG